jgi:hypothetical protein
VATTKEIKDMEKLVLELTGLEYKGLIWCELGNQINVETKQTEKKILEKLGVHHTSLDINGEDKAWKVDLNKEVPALLKGIYEVVTNYGTSEHVTNQYMCFKNIHYLCKKNGIMIHGVPLKDNWKKHGRYEYDLEFFRKLQKENGYQFLYHTILDTGTFAGNRNLLVYAMIKRHDWDFMAEHKFGGVIDTGFEENVGNYNHRGLIKKILGKVKWN